MNQPFVPQKGLANMSVRVRVCVCVCVRTRAQ